jgi:methylthioribulose-1-phosphate dehydratase
MALDVPATTVFETLCDELIAVGRRFDQSGWVPASGGNFSARVDEQTVAITASGRHKGELGRADFLRCDLQGQVLGEGTSSYETGLHLQVYRRELGVGAVLHNHSVAATVLSRQAGNVLILQGYELLKLFDGHSDPQQPLSLPVFENEQDIAALAAQIDQAMDNYGTGHAYLIEGHGLYTWGANIQQARLRVEALEFMLACELQQTMQH